MHKRLVVNIFSSLLLGAALISAPVYAAEKTVVNISKVDGMPWFNRMGEGVVQAGKEFNLNASQVGPSSTDAPQQVKIIEDLIARKPSLSCLTMPTCWSRYSKKPVTPASWC